MTKFVFSIETDSGEEIAFLVNRLFPAGEDAAPAKDPAPTTETKRRGRPPKAEEPAAPEPAAPVEAQQSSTTQSSAEPASTVTLAELKAAVTEAMPRMGAKNLLDLIKNTFGVARVDDIPQDRWPEAMEKLKA